MLVFSVDNREVVEFTARLQTMHRSHFPIAVRETLNDAAFDVKKNELLPAAKEVFTIRKSNFIKAYSGVEKATGFDVNNMYSMIGITAKGEHAALGLAKQETGGEIDKRDYIYMDTARDGANPNKLVSPKNYIRQNKFVEGAFKKNFKSKKAKFVASAIVAMNNGLFLKHKGKRHETVYKINAISQDVENKKVNVESTAIADYEQGRTVKVEQRKFIEPAAEETLKKMNKFFVKNAEKRFQRALETGK